MLVGIRAQPSVFGVGVMLLGSQKARLHLHVFSVSYRYGLKTVSQLAKLAGHYTLSKQSKKEKGVSQLLKKHCPQTEAYLANSSAFVCPPEGSILCTGQEPGRV